MSLFDVIRYPISDKPTHEELDALPSNLFKAWILSTDWEFLMLEDEYSDINPAKEISNWYAMHHIKLDTEDEKQIQNLRDMIKDYDNDNI